MAEPSAVALGRYLRDLRERRGLSLARVCEFTKHSPEPLDKGTLSRLERGQQSPSIFRLGPLSRIYEVSADALIERMELDREIDRIGGPDTEGRTYDDLHRAGAAAVVQANRKWEAYAYFRDALPLARPERRVAARINLATAARSLGKNALALHELQALEASADLDPGQRALLDERIATCCRCLGDMRRAEAYADSAVAKAVVLGDSRTLAYALCARAGVALDQEQWEVATDHILKALAAYGDDARRESQLVASPSFTAQAMLMLAECSLRLHELPRARHLVLAAKRIGQRQRLPLALAYSELLLGCIDAQDGHVDRARERWRRAAVAATQLNHHRIVFAAEVEIYGQALDAGDTARARASRRRLERLAPWVPGYIPAHRRYKTLIGQDRPRPTRAEEVETHDEVAKNPDGGVPAGVRAASGKRRDHRRRAASHGPGVSAAAR